MRRAPQTRSVFGAPLGSWLLAVVALWGARLALSWAVSRPIAAGLGGDYDDRALFEPGGVFLLEVLRLRADVLNAALGASALLLGGAWVLLLIVSTGILAHWTPPNELSTSSAPEASPRHWCVRAGRALPRVGGLALLAGGALLVLGGTWTLLATAFGQLLPTGGAPWLRELWLAFGLLVGLGLVLLVGVLFDLARAELVAGTSLRGAVSLALETFRRSWRALLALRISVAVAGTLVVAGVAAFVGTLPLEAPQTGPLLATVLAHRAAGAVLAALHVTWLARVAQATRSAARAQQTGRADESAFGVPATSPSEP